MDTHKDISSISGGPESDDRVFQATFGDTVRTNTDPFRTEVQGATGTMPVPTKQRIMASAGPNGESAHGLAIVDLASDDDSWDDWGNASTADQDIANEDASSVDEGSLLNEVENDVDDGDMTQDTITATDPEVIETVQSDVASIEDSLPSSIRALLDEWYIARGSQRPPPCAVTDAIKKNVNRARTGAAATYLHQSGEVLQNALYHLPECAKFTRKCITVAQGPTKGPFVIAFVRGKTGGNDVIGFKYFIWEGVRAKDTNGWEEKSSITKLFKSPRGAPSFQSTKPCIQKVRKVENVGSLRTGSGRQDLGPRSHAFDRAMRAEKPSKTSTLHGSTLPKHIMDEVEAWHQKKGAQFSLPFTTQHGPESLKFGKGGRQAYFVYKDGSPLDVRMHTLTMGKRQLNVIVASGANLNPSIVSATKNWSSDGKIRISTLYRIWIGLSGDREGFADGMPVTKWFKAGANSDATGTAGIISRSSHKRTTASGHKGLVLGKRSRSDSSPLPQSVHRMENPDVQKLDSHILNNAVMLFYAKEAETPRVRLLNACNSVEKLFAQALAGEVFEQSAGKTNVLSIRLSGSQRPLHVVEDDEEDFDGMIEAIKTLQCWSEHAGEFIGSCTVEIRAPA